MSPPAGELLDAQPGVLRPASRPLLDGQDGRPCSVAVPDTDSDDDDDLFEDPSISCPDIRFEDSASSKLLESTRRRRPSRQSSSLVDPWPDRLADGLFDPRAYETQQSYSSHKYTDTVSSIYEVPCSHSSDIGGELYLKDFLELPVNHRGSRISRQYSNTSSVFEDSVNCPDIEDEDSYFNKLFEPPESHRDQVQDSPHESTNTLSSVNQTPDAHTVNRVGRSYFERLFERSKSRPEESPAKSAPPPCYRHSLPPSLNNGTTDARMSYQMSEPNCASVPQAEEDPGVSHRLLELVHALADDLGQVEDGSGSVSEEEDSADIRSGCQVNLAFEDTEPDLTFNARYLDITQSDCDHLPWYFQDSEDDLSHLVYPEEDLASKRPHSIAVPSEIVSNLHDNPEFLRSHPMRSTAGFSRRVQEFQVPERPVSATEFSGHEPTVPTNQSGRVESHPASPTVNVPSKINGPSHLSDEQTSPERDTSTIFENSQFTRSNPSRSTFCMGSRDTDKIYQVPEGKSQFIRSNSVREPSQEEKHDQKVPKASRHTPIQTTPEKKPECVRAGSMKQPNRAQQHQVPVPVPRISDRNSIRQGQGEHVRQASAPSRHIPDGNPELSRARSLKRNHSQQATGPGRHTRMQHAGDGDSARREQGRRVREVPEPSAPSEEELDSPVLLRAAPCRASVAGTTRSDAGDGQFARASRQSSSMGHPRRGSAGATSGNRTSTESSDEIDWSWVASEAQRLEAAETQTAADGRPSSWLRASMRRVQHFRLGEPPRVRSAPPESIAPLQPLSAQVIPALETTGPTGAVTGGGRDFPRRYSASPLHRQTVASPSHSASSSDSHRPHRPRRRSRSTSNAAQRGDVGPGRRRSRSSSTNSTHRRRVSLRPSSSSESSEDTAPTPQPAPAASADSGAESENSTGRSCDGRSSMADEAHSPLGYWPHNLSSMLASLGCTLGLFNISRFAIFSVQFGANFILQFLFLTLVLGIPLYTFHASIGQYLAAGVMDMWKISPIFQGIGIALLVSQALIGIYSIVGVSWMFIYFRDSFITKQDRYRWAEPFEPYREESPQLVNGSWRLEETVPDYLNGVVLQRHSSSLSEATFGHLKFQVTFNLAVVWMIVFVSLSKGLKSYGKVVYVFSLFPVFGMLILCTKLLGLTPTNTSHQVFPETVWNEFFLNTKCWVAATTEVFFTWGLLGAAIMQISSHNRHKHLLHRDVSLVIILTLAILLLAAFLANTCMLLLASNGFTYVPSSFEHLDVYTFLKPEGVTSPMYAKTPVRYMTHSTFIVGCRILLPDVDSNHESGYQVLRLATEIVPATFALLGADQVSPFWAVLFYFVLILFGIAQQLAIWHCVITGIMAINAVSLKSWETTITFFSCACGFILGLPMTTELGIFVVYFLDYTVGCSWWLMVLYVLEIGAVFVVRGRPYSGENVVSTLFNKGVGCLQVWAAPMLVFTWNVILPVALMVLCITIFKNGKFRDLYNWHTAGYAKWPLWAREVGCLLQLLPIIAIPLVGIVQSCRYLSDGPPDLFDRIQLLYRPPLDSDESREQARPTNTTTTSTSTTAGGTNVVTTPSTEAAFEDPPPKYTPPPSYTTATGARIAKMLRQSFRRSMRRITSVLGDNGDGFGSTSPQIRAPLPPPPDYAAVLVEINQALQNRDQSHSADAGNIAITITDVDAVRTSAPAGNSSTATVGANTRHLSDTRMSTLTASDVAHILRSSLRRTLQRSSVRGEGREGNEQLVQGAAPIHHDMMGSQAKTEQDNTTSVI